MTLLEIKNQIVGHLCDSDIFTKDHFKVISVPQETEYVEYKDAMIRLAAKSLVDAGLLKEIAPDHWMLVQPLNASGQTLHISMLTANSIAELINTFMQANQIPGDQVDTLNITENHIVQLIETVDAIADHNP